MADPELVAAGATGLFALLVAAAALSDGHLVGAAGAACVVVGAGAVAASSVAGDVDPLLVRGGVAVAVLGAAVYAVVVLA